MFGNIGKLMKIAGEMKAKMPEMQAHLAATEHTAQAGGGAVTATVNGKLELTGIKIDRKLLADATTDAELLEDLIKAAVCAAQKKAAAAAAEAMAELTGGMGLPGMEGLLP